MVRSTIRHVSGLDSVRIESAGEIWTVHVEKGTALPPLGAMVLLNCEVRISDESYRMLLKSWKKLGDTGSAAVEPAGPISVGAPTWDDEDPFGDYEEEDTSPPTDDDIPF